MGLCEVKRASRLYRSLLLTFVLAFSASQVWGYRLFVSTDADVAGPEELEIEFGSFALEREAGKNTVIVPQVVLNYGFTRDWELVGEFEVEKSAHENAQIVDPAIFLKAILKEGILQKTNGISLAVEAGPLLPSTVVGERQFGFEGIGIVSGKFFPFTYHVNVGGGVDTIMSNPLVLWGVIVELPVSPHLRLVGEVNGESVQKRLPDESALLGLIWQPSSSAISFDGGIRKGMSGGAADWQFTTGLTYGFSLPFAPGTFFFGGRP